MKALLRIVGWLLMAGAAANALMALVALFVVASAGFAEPGLTVETLIREHVSFLGWTKPATEAILPDRLAHFFFAAPALLVFPLRALVAGWLGLWALRASKRR